jgi:hypothetical protein
METTPTTQQSNARPKARKHAAKGEIMAVTDRAERIFFAEILSDSGFGGEYSTGGTGLRPMKDLRMDSTEKYIAKHAPSVSPSGFSGPQTSTHGGRFFGFGARNRGCPFHNTLPASDMPPEEAGDAEESQPFPAGGSIFATRKRVSKREHVRVRPEQKETAMKKSKTMQIAFMVAAWVLAGGAWAAEVKNVTAKYQWPWGVGLSYEVVGTIPTDAWIVVTAKDRANNTTYTAQTNALSGDTGTTTGKHQVFWDLDKQGVKLQSTNVVFTVESERKTIYCVVDLSGGAHASTYPVTRLAEPPSGGFNTDTYKTTKLVLRRIEPGTFMMSGEYQVTLTKPFFIGLFEVTQKQWTLVMGSNPSQFKGDMRPVECVWYDDIRGSSAGTNWPASSAVDASSFMGKLRAKTGLDFDLPTEAQWEYACRAGTTSAYNNGGNSTNDLKQLGRYYYNGGDNGEHAKVGSYKPNAWGLYDMHGNVEEWCLDWYGNLTDGMVDPKGATYPSSWRVSRGGCWCVDPWYCTSGSRTPLYLRDYAHGFRLVRRLSE